MLESKFLRFSKEGHSMTNHHKKFFNYYLSDFDANWCTELSYSQSLLMKNLGFYDQ